MEVVKRNAFGRFQFSAKGPLRLFVASLCSSTFSSAYSTSHCLMAAVAAGSAQMFLFAFFSNPQKSLNGHHDENMLDTVRSQLAYYDYASSLTCSHNSA